MYTLIFDPSPNPQHARDHPMKREFSIAVFQGDGIGPEIMKPTQGILSQLSQRSDAYSLSFETVPAGAAHYAETGESLPEASLQSARKADAILLSAMGLPSIRYEDGTEISPQIELRKALDLFAGVRPVRIFRGQNSPLSLENHEYIDFVLIRESTEGLFFSQGAGDVNDEEATETLKITRRTSEKLFKFAFNMARERKASGDGRGHVTCVDKANVFRAFAFFRSLFDAEASKHTDLTSDHAYVDATALWMVQKPWIFDVMVTENMFGDILSDLGAGLMGGLGLAPSADIGENHGLFQPCHGSAPDIAGKNVANPFAMILSAAMMLDWLGQKHENADMVRDGKRLRSAVYDVVNTGTHTTVDIGGKASTLEACDAVERALNQ